MGEYREATITLAAFPLMPLTVMVEDERLIWFPVRHMCEDHLRIDNSSQQRKVKEGEEYTGLWRQVPFQTVKGVRDTFCLEFEGLAHWLSSLQEHSIDATQREYVRAYRRSVWAGASRLLLTGETAAQVEGRSPLAGLPSPSASPETAQRRLTGRDVAQHILEERLAYLEEGYASLTRGEATGHVPYVLDRDDPGIINVPFHCPGAGDYIIRLRNIPWSAPEVVEIVAER